MLAIIKCLQCKVLAGTPSLNPEQVVSFEELLMSQVVQQEAVINLLIEKGIFTKEEFLEMVKLVDQRMKVKRKLESGVKV